MLDVRKKISVKSECQIVLKKLSLLFILFLGWNTYGQDTASVQVIARSLPEKVMLRWAVDQPLAWKKTNEYGFWVERATISQNGEAVLPLEKTVLTLAPIKPAPLQAWEALATTDQNAAVVAQALYGDTFETTAPTGGALAEIYAVNAALEQRFTFSLLAAEQNYEAAKLAGWAYEDNSIQPNESYLYTIKVALPHDSPYQIADGAVYAGADQFEALPKPIGLAAVFGDGHVALSWNFNLLQNTYTRYSIERSVNGVDFETLNRAPIFNAQQSQETSDISLFFNDSIPNGKTYYYRVKGRTAFNETGPPSDIVEGQATQQLGFVPRINRKILPTDDSVILEWEFDEKGNELISGFELRRANTIRGPFETVQQKLPATSRKTSYSGLGRINYFAIVAMGKNGVESESYPTMVQPVDSVPPAPPSGLGGTIDTLGVVRLQWSTNIEKDLGGYRIYRANNPDSEFNQITKTAVNQTVYIDTIAVKNLNETIYYKILAEDQRYNASEFSDILVLEKPDLSPPSPAVLQSYKVTDEGVQLKWIPSSSKDVASHLVYRRDLSVGNALWEPVYKNTLITENTFTDTSVKNGQAVAYTIVAQDSTGWESSPSNPLEVVVRSKKNPENGIKFSATANRELRFIGLSWRQKNVEVIEWRLYRGREGEPLKLYKTLDGTTKTFNDTDLEINTDYVYGLQAVSKSGVVSGIEKVNVKY
ncbi:hypothetical protein [Allomuricauda sp. d1]|uniref:fibronectin type III domain-containing protein n=1 Tax=Allomuricauda sp. d1 TaxID=3136725 RepID=UPI0031DFF758